MNRLPLLLYHKLRRFSILFCVGNGGRRNFALTSTTPMMGALFNQRKIAPVTNPPNFGRVVNALIFEGVTIFRGVLTFEDTNQRKSAFVTNAPKVGGIELSATLRPSTLSPKMGCEKGLPVSATPQVWGIVIFDFLFGQPKLGLSLLNDNFRSVPLSRFVTPPRNQPKVGLISRPQFWGQFNMSEISGFSLNPILDSMYF